MSDSTLHIGALASNNIVNDAGKYDECKEKVKDLTKEIQTRKDIFEKMAEPLVYVCDCYQKFNVVTGMPKSTFGDSFGYDMQKDISSHMSDFYAGKVSRDELSSYFEECCTSMRTYRTSQHQTSGTNESDNTQIVSEMYEVFAKENARAASQANYQEGKALNEKNYSDSHSDWTYYNSDYYYQCNEINAALRKSVQQMTEKWNLDEIDCDKIEANSSLTLDGGFDFNSTWNFEFRNQAGRSSLAKESAIPPENFKMFFKEQVTSFTEDNKFNGNLKITIGENNYDLKVPFQTLRTGSEGEICNVWDLMEDYLVVENGQTKAFHEITGYEIKTYNEVFNNRDPRMEQTFMKPGTQEVGIAEAHRPSLNLGGYPQIKFRPLTIDQMEWGKSYTDLPIIRYAEILLMYAEAKAELGILNQADVDNTINLIRNRAGMPLVQLSDWLADIDPIQAQRYANVNSSQKGAVLEIRRERRIELACEGFRFDDLMRWGCGELLEKAPEG